MWHFTLKKKKSLMFAHGSRCQTYCCLWFMVKLPKGGAGRCLRHGCVCAFHIFPHSWVQLGAVDCVPWGRNHIFANMNFALYPDCSLIHHSRQDDFAFPKQIMPTIFTMLCLKPGPMQSLSRISIKMLNG